MPPPEWQPDSEVTECPVCHTEFSFWYRKHHCRKCGRVVCGACSPHRITIPRQYVLQPSGREGPPTIPAIADRINPTLEGGEVVRVCNPCVPDPWTPDGYLQSNAGLGIGNVSQSERTSYPADSAQRRSSRSQVLNPGSQNVLSSGAVTMLRHDTAGDNATVASTSHSRQPGLENGHGQGRSSQQPITTHRSNASQRHSAHFDTSGSARSMLPPSVPAQDYWQRSRSSTVGSRAVPASAASPAHQSSASTSPTQTRRHIQRPRVREQDECPVCGVEMPKEDGWREDHIKDCIANRFSTSTPRAVPSSLDSSGTDPPTSTSAADPPDGAEAPSTRTRASTYRPRGMAVYRATEKDCTNAEGEAQECVICFEEFQAGDELGRMECLCKFHRLCIRSWWDTKGRGACPTHQLHNET